MLTSLREILIFRIEPHYFECTFKKIWSLNETKKNFPQPFYFLFDSNCNGYWLSKLHVVKSRIKTKHDRKVGGSQLSHPTTTTRNGRLFNLQHSVSVRYDSHPRKLYIKQVVVKVRTLTLVRGIFATWKRNCLVFFLDKKENETKVTRLISVSSLGARENGG